MKIGRNILFFLLLVLGGMFVGCSASLNTGAYENSLTIVNATTKLDDGKVTILSNGYEKGIIYNTPEQNRVTLNLFSGFFSNVYTGRQFSILAIGSIKGKTVAAERSFYAGTMQMNHEAWILTDQMFQPYNF